MKRGFVLIIFLTIVVSLFINYFIKSRKEDKISYNFIITKIDVTKSKRLILNGITFYNFTIMDNMGIELGDSIVKEPSSKSLTIYKKQDNSYVEYKKLSAHGLFSFLINDEKKKS